MDEALSRDIGTEKWVEKTGSEHSKGRAISKAYFNVGPNVHRGDKSNGMGRPGSAQLGFSFFRAVPKPQKQEP